MTTTETVRPTCQCAAYDCIFEYAAHLLDEGAFRGLDISDAAFMALTDAYDAAERNEDRTLELRQLGDLVWQEAGTSLFYFCTSTDDRRKVARLFRRIARNIGSMKYHGWGWQENNALHPLVSDSFTV